MVFLKVFLFYFLRNELSIFKNRLVNFIFFIKKQDSINKNKSFIDFLKSNTNFWEKQNNKRKFDKSILITNNLSHPAYTSSEIIIGKNLMTIHNADGIALINQFDIKSKKIFKSYGINKIFYLNNLNFILRLKYFLKSFNTLINTKNIDDLLKIKINDIDYGKIIYDHCVRFSGIGTIDKVLDIFYSYLFKCFLIEHQVNYILNQNDIVATVQTERQFIPGAVLFQSALVNKKKVYSRIGASNKFCVVKYDDLNDKFRSRYKFSKKLFEEINIKIGEKARKEGEKIIIERFRGINEKQVFHEFFDGPDFRKQKIINTIDKVHFTKKELCDQLGWNIEKPINVIFSSDLTDGIFDQRWSIFRDRLTMLRETLKIAANISNVNWIVKPHPNDLLHKVITSTSSEFEKICENKNHVKLIPNNVSISSLPKIVNLAVTINGSVASEYPSFGVPTVVSAEAICSNFGFNITPKNYNEYASVLKNSHKLEKLPQDQMDRAKIFIYLYTEIMGVKSEIIPENDSRDFDEKKYWNKMKNLIDNHDVKKNNLLEMMKIQHEKNDRHAVNYKLITD